ncbi:MAG: hypothetical protein HY782_01225 [Chloroflexi bacterium]|nr:hypothetical protein [Chloroflexota bacterium]
MAEIAPAGGGGPNRLFIVLAIGLAALLILGLLGLGGFLVIQNLFRPGPAPTARIAVATATRVLGTPTLAATPTLVVEAPNTPTLVLSAGGQGTAAAPGTPGTATPTIIGGTPITPTTGTPGTGTPGTGQLPETGLGEDLMLLAGGVVLVLIVFAARRARTA